MPQYFRHAVRHLQTGVEDRVHAILDAGNWLSAPTAFNARPVLLVRRRLEDKDVVSGNTVAVLFGDETADLEAELGGGLRQFRLICWVDIIATSDAILMALSADLKDGLTGRNPAFSPWLPVLDYTTTRDGVAVPGWSAEFIEVARSKPDPSEWRRDWATINAVLEVSFW